MTSGWCWHTATFSDTLPRTPQRCMASNMRQKPARLP
jgi:hypothetical protein